MVDHKFLNDVFDFIPTSEKMVEYFAALLIGGFYSFQINSNFELERVRLYETTNSYAEWKR